MSEETITFNVVYKVENIDDSIRQTQRALLFSNALRLSMVDIQKVMAGPTIANVMWTAIQLTRVWTNLIRLLKGFNAEQKKALGISFLGGAVRGRAASIAARGFAGGQGVLSFGAGGALGVGSVSQTGLWATMTAFAAANPFVIAGLAAGLVVAGSVAYDVRETRKRNDWRRQQREVARRQGLGF